MLIDGESIYHPKYNVTSLRRRVGMVFQKSNPFPKSIFENIAYGLRINGVRDRYEIESIVEKSLKSTALWDEVKDRLDESALGLSGGQQQRLCIARTIAVQPEVILMDEPASALDPISTQKIEELIQDLKMKLHDRHRDPQHAAGRAGERLDGLFLHGRAHRVQHDRKDIHQAGQRDDRELHHRKIRIERPHGGFERGGTNADPSGTGTREH